MFCRKCVAIKKGQLTIEEKQNSLSYREIVSIIFFSIKRHLETEGNSDRERSGRPKATTESEKPNFWELPA